MARGEGAHGLGPVTHQAIAAWAQLTDRHPEPHEVHALLVLDAVTRFPDAGLEASRAESPKAAPRPWPVKERVPDA